MVEEKKLKIPVWVKLLLLLLIAVGIVIWGVQKGEWVETSYSQRELNIMKLDENVASNNAEHTNYIWSIGEFQMKGNLVVKQGTVEAAIRMGEQEVLHEIYETGNYEFETDVFNAADARASGASEVQTGEGSEVYAGTVNWYFEISDDAEGFMTTSFYTRQTNFERLYNRLLDIFASDNSG